MLDTYSLSAIFLSCADAGSFAAAGRRLNLSRSSVGKAIARLEGDLGVRLFHRTSRHQGLTEEGEIFLQHATRAQGELEAAKEVFASGRGAPSGMLRVTAPTCLGRHCVAPVLLDFASRHGSLSLALSLSDRPVDIIEEGFDIGIRIGATLDVLGVAGRKIGTQVMRSYAASSYLDAHGTPESRAELEGHRFLGYMRGRAMRRRQSGAASVRRTATATIAMQADDLDLLLDMAVRGLGIASLPHWLAADRVRQGLLSEVVGIGSRTFDITVLWPRSDHVPLRTRAAISFLAERMPMVLANGLAALSAAT